MDRAALLRRLLADKERVRAENWSALQQRLREAAQTPEIAELLTERSALMTQSLGAAFARQPIDTDALRTQLEALNQRIRDALVRNGMAQDYLQPIYDCALCRDTGYVGDPIHELCVCIRQQMMDATCAAEQRGGLGKHTFDQFDLSAFPDETPGEAISQREHMRRIERAARRYAADFPDNERPNLLFYGGAGLGKTFVADCIASALMRRSVLVRRVTAYRMAEIMRKNQFDGSEEQAVIDLQTSELLLIDDLGTEPQTRSTSGYLFQVMNERYNEDRHTIISTNLTPDQLARQYGERVASRLLDTSRTAVIRFYGRDLRLERRTP